MTVSCLERENASRVKKKIANLVHVSMYNTPSDPLQNGFEKPIPLPWPHLQLTILLWKSYLCLVSKMDAAFLNSLPDKYFIIYYNSVSPFFC